MKKLVTQILVILFVAGCSEYRSQIEAAPDGKALATSQKIQIGEDYFVDADRVKIEGKQITFLNSSVQTQGNVSGEYWDGDVPILFEDNVPAVTRDLFWQACRDFNVRCVCYSSQTDYVRVRLGPGISGGRSYADNIGKASPVTLEIAYGQKGHYATIAHELGHALGLTHEQQREDRDQFVRITDDEWNHTITGFTAGDFDFASIMLYPCSAGVIPLNTDANPCGSDGYSLSRLSSGDRSAVRATKGSSDLRQCIGNTGPFDVRLRLEGDVNASLLYTINGVAGESYPKFPGTYDILNVVGGSDMQLLILTDLPYGHLIVTTSGGCYKEHSDLILYMTINRNEECRIDIRINENPPPPPPDNFDATIMADNGRYLCPTLTNGVQFNCDELANPSIWFITDLNGGRLESGDLITLRSTNMKHLVAEGGGGGLVNANRDEAGAWETFEVLRVDGPGTIEFRDRIALRSADGQYLAAENGGGGIVNANRSGIGPWETFLLERY